MKSGVSRSIKSSSVLPAEKKFFCNACEPLAAAGKGAIKILSVRQTEKPLLLLLFH